MPALWALDLGVVPISLRPRVRDTLIAESKAQEKLMGTPNQMETVMAGMQKRKAEFKD